ncbi:DUF3617 domain-containing protein [Rhodanobacter geophilus]|uniref:DUF3617 domain-containing protein n=1 Tax=Rhodanobacter geophilus TaxID=3162488 RepID=A0ABV3QK01_9GAMM
MTASVRGTVRRMQVAVRRFGLPVLLSGVACVAVTRADPADFQAMPGLWRVVLRVVSNGHAGPARVEWHCVNEGDDPWARFAALPMPAPQCRRSDQHRSSTALDWTLSCAGMPVPSGRGRVEFDTPEHYTASISLQGRGEVLQVEGVRRAACTGPSD